MDEAISLMFQGSRLAGDLEEKLQHYLSNKNQIPAASAGEMFSESCDEIIKTFVSAKERLVFSHSSSSSSPSPSPHPPFSHPHQLFSTGQEASLQQWLRSALGGAAGGLESRSSVQVPVTASESVRLLAGSSSSPPPHSSSLQQRPRRRKDDVEKRTVRVAAPLMGNTEAPPDDGFTWRKYGQKEILGSRFPRGYFRCTHQRMYQCPAKKQVQRLDHDPYTFQVTYRGEHTCHMSATAPSIAPPAHITATSSGGTHQLAGPPQWVEFNLGSSGGGGTSSNVNTMVEGSTSGDMTSMAGPSYLVAEMADVMFNSGNTSTNSMEFLFQSPQQKWEPEDKQE